MMRIESEEAKPMRIQLVDPFIWGRLRMKTAKRFPTKPKTPTRLNIKPGMTNSKVDSPRSCSLSAIVLLFKHSLILVPSIIQWSTDPVYVPSLAKEILRFSLQKKRGDALLVDSKVASNLTQQGRKFLIFLLFEALLLFKLRVKKREIKSLGIQSEKAFRWRT